MHPQQTLILSGRVSNQVVAELATAAQQRGLRVGRLPVLVRDDLPRVDYDLSRLAVADLYAEAESVSYREAVRAIEPLMMRLQITKVHHLIRLLFSHFLELHLGWPQGQTDVKISILKAMIARNIPFRDIVPRELLQTKVVECQFVPSVTGELLGRRIEWLELLPFLMSEIDLIDIHGFGPMRVIAISVALAGRGLYLSR